MYVLGKELDYEIIYQGDLIKDFPFLIFDNKTLTKGFENNVETKLEIKAKLGLIMVLSQTCDIQQRENIIVCPVYKMQDFDFNKEETESIKKRKTGYWFYLPRQAIGIDESIADFQTIYYVPKDLLNQYKSNKILTLTDWGRHHLDWALSNYFGRPIESKS